MTTRPDTFTFCKPPTCKISLPLIIPLHTEEMKIIGEYGLKNKREAWPDVASWTSAEAVTVGGCNNLVRRIWCLNTF